MDYLLAHDLGTTGNKASLISTEGVLIKKSVCPYETHFFNNTHAEQNPLDWWKAVQKTSRDITAQIDPSRIAALSLSGQMMGCVVVDQKGDPLRPAIIWADTRAQNQADFINSQLGQKEFYKITGHRISSSYSLEKLMWIRDNEPEIFSRIYKMLNAKDFIIQKLTGVFITDYTDASGTNAFDLGTLKWSEKILDLAGIDKKLLPDPASSIYCVGSVRSDIASQLNLKSTTKVILGGGDGLCAAVGAGSVDNGRAFHYIGSSAWIAVTTDKPVYDDELRTFNWVHIVPGKYTPNGTMQTAGASYSWYKNEICNCTFKEMDTHLKKSPPGAKGLLFLPYLLGERSPRWNKDALGAFVGFTIEHTRSDMTRAVAEGISLNMKIILSILQSGVDFDIEDLCVIGGGALSDQLMQTMADIYEIKLKTSAYLQEATSIGAAITAGVGAGLYENFNVVDTFLSYKKSFSPCVDKGKTELYKNLLVLFEETYKALVPVYKDIRRTFSNK